MAGKSIKDNYLILETIIYGMDNAGNEIILEKETGKLSIFLLSIVHYPRK